MCGVAEAGLALSALGTAAQVKGQMDAASAAKGTANYQAAIMRNNAILAQRAADDARDRGKEEARREQIAKQQLIGRQRAVLAGNNVVVDTGSALDITSDTAAAGKLNELTIRSNAEREALGFEAQGMNFNADAQLVQLRGANEARAGRSAAFTTLLSGAGSVASKWYNYKKTGVIA